MDTDFCSDSQETTVCIQLALMEETDEVVSVHTQSICTTLHRQKQDGCYTAEFAV